METCGFERDNAKKSDEKQDENKKRAVRPDVSQRGQESHFFKSASRPHSNQSKHEHQEVQSKSEEKWHESRSEHQRLE
eukprot:2538356-Amphidinium_carterae.2